MKYFTNLVEDELAYNIAYIENEDRNVWWYDGEKLSFKTPNAAMILGILSNDPYATYPSLSERVGINVSAVRKLIDGMVEKGYVQRRDTDHSWYVLASSIII